MAGCDRCSMCCKVIQIADPDLEKPANVWCKHCTKPGCGIYTARPKPCIDYACVWLQSQDDVHPLSLSFRPDKCHVVIDITEDNVFAICRVDPNYPSALNMPEMQIWIRVLATHHSVISIIGRKRTIISLTEPGRKKLQELGFNDKDKVWYE